MRKAWSELALASAGDHAACRAMIRHGSKSFHAASLVLPRRVRQPAYALYAFCRAADDAVDLGGRADAVARLSERLARVYAGAPEPHPVDRAFADTVARHAIPRALPEALIEGLAWDLAGGRRYETLADLHAYSARVAGTVGAMMTLLMGVRDRAALARACDLGCAMQLSNIARDVGEDARAGRLYLPRAWLREAGIDADRFLAAPTFAPALGQVVSRLLAEAERLYDRAAPGIAMLPADCRPAIAAARLIYREIGREVAARGFDSVASRAVVGRGRKLGLLAAASLGARLPVAGARGLAPLDETRFLVEAVEPQPVWAARPRSVGRVMWTIEMLLEQGRRTRGPDSGAIRIVRG
ncbi:phytoene/squalene synthase family protein [Limibaculum sp. FT325]|uniref:phytoene/squalene synthase family protein n=1 Tax=Thermohalobaculum sediminis TaxID=2939436 RepID=UPI0020C0DEBA|nr:phytoene/squalene synthase family protein [Limibaculum sediminis]MCL5775736.1 phytoene/squalene synthase family protein [Limibaculum sediminis]